MRVDTARYLPQLRSLQSLQARGDCSPWLGRGSHSPRADNSGGIWGFKIIRVIHSNVLILVSQIHSFLYQGSDSNMRHILRIHIASFSILIAQLDPGPDFWHGVSYSPWKWEWGFSKGFYRSNLAYTACFVCWELAVLIPSFYFFQDFQFNW